MRKIDINKIHEHTVGKNIFIECDELIVGGHFTIEDNVTLSAKKIYLGNHAKIEKNTKIAALSGEMDLFYMGDESLIGFNSQVMVPKFIIGDYSRIFNSSLCSGYKPITLGHNCWVGQSTILNSAEKLTIGNNVRMGGSSQIWTHVASGELLEGCKFYSEKPVIIEDNVWLMGFGHTVSPGIILGRNSIIMSGSVVCKSTEPFHTYSGIPAIDVTDKLSGWRTPSLEDKFQLLKAFLNEFVEFEPKFADKIFCFNLDEDDDKKQFKQVLAKYKGCLVFLKKISDLLQYKKYTHSIFDLYSKLYLKRRSDIEISWMKFAMGHRARFVPIDYSNGFLNQRKQCYA